jgi:hypothetical protein
VIVGFRIGYCGTFAYSNIATMYFDWNRDGDFADAGEAAIGKSYGAAALTGTYYSGKIRIPVTATPGKTMMRVVVVEASTVSPTGTYSFGETEDYAINILSQVSVNPNFTYSWNPGGFTRDTAVVTPSSTTPMAPNWPSPKTAANTVFCWNPWSAVNALAATASSVCLRALSSGRKVLVTHRTPKW